MNTDMSNKKKGSGWKHPKTGKWWKSKKDYHKYWEVYIKPKSKKQKVEEARKYKLEIILEDNIDLYADLMELSEAQRNKIVDSFEPNEDYLDETLY
jgi:hypothetical protein